MSQGLKFKFDQMRDNDPSSGEQSTISSVTSYGEAYSYSANVRNLCFVLKSGRRVLLNYAYLIAADYEPEKAEITYSFSTHTVIVKGSKLGVLFEATQFHTPMKIICIDERYHPLNKDETCIYAMEIIPKE